MLWKAKRLKNIKSIDDKERNLIKITSKFNKITFQMVAHI